MTRDLDLTADVIDVRDIIARVEELEETRESLRVDFDSDDANAGADFDRWVCDMAGSAWSRDDEEELTALRAVLADLRGNGGDERWRGDWYPVTLVRDSYFTDYARDLVEDCGYIAKDFPTWIEVDWDATARNVRMDYTSVDIDGTEYWYR